MQKYLTVSKAAEIMDCHPETLRRLNRRGILEAKRNYLGHRIFDLEEVLKVKRERERLRDARNESMA